MRHETHELVGASLALATDHAVHAGPVQTAGLVAAALCGSWLPDIDQLGARIHGRSRFERRSVIVGAFGAAIRLPAVAFAALVPHRAITHSAVACAAVAFIAAVIVPSVGTGAALVVGGGVGIGYGAHVIADACTPGGVRLWSPFSRRRVWLLPPRFRIPTGSWREAAFAGLAGAAVAVALLA